MAAARPLAALALDVPGVLHVGSVRVPLFGVIASVGVVAALLLSQLTARFVRVSATALWDAGMVAVLAAFAASRLVLIAAAPTVFARVPGTVLLLPSLSPIALLLAAVATYAWLRWKRLPLLDVLDAWAPCACVLAAVLALAHFVEGTDAGMPTRLPWGVVTPGDHILGRVHPVEIYALLVWLALAAWSLRALSRRARAGQVAGQVLVLGGAASFLLDMLRQPIESQGSAWLDPTQYAALAFAGVGLEILLYKPARRLSRAEAATILERFVSGESKGLEHEAIEFGMFSDPLLDEVQRRFPQLPHEFPPPQGSGWYCAQEGIEVLKSYVARLRDEPISPMKETR